MAGKLDNRGGWRQWRLSFCGRVQLSAQGDQRLHVRGGDKGEDVELFVLDEKYFIKNFITCFPSAVTIFFFWWRRQCAKAQLQLSFNFDNNSCVYARCMRVACACYLSSVKGVRYPKFGINVTGNATATEKEPLIRSWGFQCTECSI